MEPVIQLTSAFLAWADRDYKTQEKYASSEYLDDPRAIQLARVIEQDLGVTQVRVLGGGSFGVAAATADMGGDVIKLTLDSTEVESGTVLTNTGLDAYPANVVHVQGAWYVRKLRIFADSWYDPSEDEWHHAQKRIGILRMERVQSLDEWQDHNAIKGLSEYTRFAKNENKVWAHQIRKLSRAKARERFLQAGSQLEGLLLGASKTLLDAGNPEGNVPRDVARAIGQLRTLGIYGIDFHGGNVGWVPLPAGAGALASEAGSSQPGYTEEDLTYRDVKFKVYGSGRSGYRVIIYSGQFHPSGYLSSPGDMPRDEAIAWAHGEIDRVIANTPARIGYAPPARLFKVFDVGMSSVGPKAPKPVEIGRSKPGRPRPAKRDEEAFSPPILASPVEVAELG